MKKKRFLITLLLFIILTSLEAGILLEVIWHGWGGFGDVTLEYTTTGLIGIRFLTLLIPVTVTIFSLIRITLCIKKKSQMKELLFDCICALSGIGIGLGIFYLVPNNPIFQLGRLITAFIIDLFGWMAVPIP